MAAAAVVTTTEDSDYSDAVQGDMAPYFIPPDVPPPLMASVRTERFPSVEQRVKLYLSDWYAPPCADYKQGRILYHYNTNSAVVVSNNSTDWTTLTLHEPEDRPDRRVYLIESAITADRAFFVDRDTLVDCGRRGPGHAKFANRVFPRGNMFLYCSDAAQSLLMTYDHVVWEQSFYGATNHHDAFPPVLLQFGDLRHSHEYRFMDVPHIKKFRSATTRHELERVTSATCVQEPRYAVQTPHTDPSRRQLQPIVWKLATSRHFRLLYKVHRHDTPWSNKTNMAVFRGQLTGSRDGFSSERSDEENCLSLRRCRLVYTHARSKYVHARLTSTRHRLPNVLNGVQLVSKPVEIRRLLQFKAIIMLEGNDVASGLKWALLSQSVVLMPVPKHTSWAMEELLEPWVHYVPLNDDATDVEEKMRWVIEHDEIAQRIAERSTLWMEDMVFHPDALEDDRKIQEEILRRYAAHFEEERY